MRCLWILEALTLDSRNVDYGSYKLLVLRIEPLVWFYKVFIYLYV